MESNSRFNDILGRFRARFERTGENAAQNDNEEDLIHAVIQRIDVEGEVEQTRELTTATEADWEEIFRRLLKRLQWQISKSGIGAEELVRTYPGEVWAVVLHKSYERYKNKPSDLLRTKFIETGLKNVQPGLWVLPPNKAPRGLASQDELRMWVRKEFAKPFGKDFDYVFSFVAVVDLKKVISEKKGIRKMPVARTVYNVLDVNEVVPPSHLYATLKARGYGVRDIILRGDIAFLTSAFAQDDEMEAIREHEDEIRSRLMKATGSAKIALEDIANLGPDVIATAFEGLVPHPRDLAQRLIVEAQYWMRFLGGAVPGMRFLGGPSTG